MSERAPRADGNSNVVLIGVAVVGALAAIVWAGAALAAFISHRDPLGAALADATNALFALPKHLTRPASAWPPSAAARLPGPALYWACQLVVLAAFGAAAIWLWRLRERHCSGTQPLGLRPHAGFARPVDVGVLRVAAPVAGRLTLGRSGRRLLAAEPDASLAVVGPTGCGKTAGFAIPALLEWHGPVLATSVKTDLLARTFEHRRRCGRVWIYDPAQVSGTTPSSWSPLTSCHDWSGALRMAAWLTAAAAPRKGLEDADYWYSQARRALAPYLFAGARDGRTLAEVVSWVDAADHDAVEEILSRCAPADRGQDAHPALVVANGLWRKEERVRSSVFSTMENVLAAFADPGVGDAAAGFDHFDPAEWLSGDNTLYVVATAHEQARLRPVFTVLVQQALRAAYETATGNGGRLERPCLALLDEAANIAPLRDLPGYAATARSHGITFVSVWQDLAQLRALYGDQAASLLNNHRAKLFGSGIADAPTLSYLSTLVGEHAVRETSLSRDLGGGRGSVVEREAFRATAPADVLRRLRPNEGVVVYGSELPVHVRLRPWFEDGGLRVLAA